jgi:phosphotransferase system  glucose/maltose/N-acetylglucosamine-specific IIC component
MKKLGSVIIAVVAGGLGWILTFVNPKTVIAWGLGFGRHNDRVLVGVLLLVIAFVSLYKFVSLFGKKTITSTKRKSAKKTKSKKRKSR